MYIKIILGSKISLEKETYWWQIECLYHWQRKTINIYFIIIPVLRAKHPQLIYSQMHEESQTIEKSRVFSGSDGIKGR